MNLAAEQAAEALKSLIPSWGLDFSTPSMQLLAPTKLFCIEAMTTPGFSTAPCAVELGCSHAGRGTPKSQMQAKENQADTESSSASLLQVDRSAAKTSRSCQTFPAWRLKYTAGSEIPLGPLAYGGSIGDWDACLHLCSTTQDCAQVVFAGGHCYGMSVASSEDQDALGGSNSHYTSAHCSGQVDLGKTFARNCETAEKWRFAYTAGSEIPLGSTAYGGQVENWQTCLDLCSETEACQQVVFSNGHCWGMSQRSSQDQDGIGGNNTNWISAHCYGEMCPELPMGDRFVDLGPWRLAAWDDEHLSIANRVGRKAIVFRQDGAILHSRSDLLAFERSVSAPYHVLFGFQFIQIGQFRIGAVNDTCFSISHSNGNTIQAFWSGGGNFVGPLRDQGTDAWDRPQSAAEGIAFGDRFLQFGKFRLAVLDTSEESPLVLSHSAGVSNQYWRSDGTSHASSDSSQDWSSVMALPGAHWECQGLDELTFGACSNFGGFGDRFIELGKWRLAAIDETHFSISHQDGQTPQIFRADGVMISGRTDYSAWHRPKGFPSGITFGSAFIQIGNFRLGDGDGRHFTLSHKIGETVRVIQCFRSDGTLWGEQGNPWTLWDRTTGPATGVVYGDRFLQIGQWRLGALNDDTFVVEHSTGHTVQTYYSWNEMKSGGLSGYHGILYTLRYSEFHCGPIQSIFGSCVGITMGKSWIQLGDWRIGDFEGTFGIAHKDGRTVRYFASDGSAFQGPTSYFNTWALEAKDEKHSEVTLGDRFIQMGPWWRLGADDHTLSLTHAGGNTAMKWSSSGIATAGPGLASELSLWTRGATAGGVGFGDRFMQVGKFRIGDVDGKHLAVSYEGTVAELFRNDAWIASGPRNDLTTFGRPLEECSLF